jgi:hypothetical protein
MRLRQDQIANYDQTGELVLCIGDIEVGDLMRRLVISQKDNRFLDGRRLRKYGQRWVHHLADRVLDDPRQRLRGLQP